MKTSSILDANSSTTYKTHHELPPLSTTTARKPPSKAAVRVLYRTGSGTTTSVVIDYSLDPGGGNSEADSRTNNNILMINNINNNKLPSSRYKGVVPQPNGRWGAQIYEKHQRVWLGTFNEEADAARAYDVAVQRFRGGDGVTNFEPLYDEAELRFLGSRPKLEVVDMLRKHTYYEELLCSKLRTTTAHLREEADHAACGGGSGGGRKVVLFEKVVTPSDVGRLNRLVIPKQHAKQHFPRPRQGGKKRRLPGSSSCCPKGVLLNFEDANRKVWRFRYSYWNSSQSYVLTRGWSRFVKETSLKAGDTVSFQRSTVQLNPQLYIQCKPRIAAVESEVVGPMLRLFGVDIYAGSINVNENGKREREV